jgi:hypothetical protein
MATQIQYRRGTDAQNSAFTGALAEITVDTTNGTLRVHDGITAGGSNIATVSYVTSQISALSANSISSGTSNVRVVSSGGNVTTSVGGIADVVVVATTGAFVTGDISATGNITGLNLNSSNADLAEMYQADVNYSAGTVVEFGGINEVTITTASHSTQVAGIVSTNPGYLMNIGLADQNAVEVALVGRVPCRVVGTIAKGDRLVSSATPGVATRLDMAQYQPGCIVGKALEAYDSDSVGTIEVAVGRV